MAAGQVTSEKSFVLLSCMDQGGSFNPLQANLGSCDSLAETRNISLCDECPGMYCVPGAFKQLQNESALLDWVSPDEENELLSDSSSKKLLVVGMIGFLLSVGMVLACVLARGCCTVLSKKKSKIPNPSGLSVRGIISTDTVCIDRDLEVAYNSTGANSDIHNGRADETPLEETILTAEVCVVGRPVVETATTRTNGNHDDSHGTDTPTTNPPSLPDPLSRRERAIKESALDFPENMVHVGRPT